MNVAGSRAPAGRPKILTREDFAKQQQASAAPNSGSNSPSTGQVKRKNRNNKSRNKKKSNSKGIKLSIRLLPPNLQQDEFWNKVSDLVNQDSILEKYFVQGKYSNKPFKLPIYSRAYIQFKDSKKLDEFVAKYKDVTFEDDRESMIPQFQLALLNRVPDSSRQYLKPKQSLENMLSYKTFLKFLNGEIERPTSFLISETVEKREKDLKEKDSKEKEKLEKKKLEKKEKKKQEKKDKKKKDEGIKTTDESNKPKVVEVKQNEGDVVKKDKPKRQRQRKPKQQTSEGDDKKENKPKENKRKENKPKDQKPKEPKEKSKEKPKDQKPKDSKPKDPKPKDQPTASKPKPKF
ncbi:hypothetical protein WICANDRAFT_85489 [Wickerhamomyces anomalus NRRL Y-366-8]|uniref:UPF3 domain-containing protein n=1 Tax=Wickerhamomyces anomalus (strain ATCC 58044 / CBS 1984 / NCYC 433 / NRRL Y-366-8) TaxID=683960 RepID=A0A1E3P0L6_WICAA|nr:uncharacterized protein WICANDRAFT_85489 [Wickerhamomyces anomalus NRRL Y-366-8]ODQ58457.1 hypothetical protein WICANDRAFT_85489 [Wickerhamomyces anomalus NRRL Y-366-8]